MKYIFIYLFTIIDDPVVMQGVINMVKMYLAFAKSTIALFQRGIRQFFQSALKVSYQMVIFGLDWVLQKSLQWA